MSVIYGWRYRQTCNTLQQFVNDNMFYGGGGAAEGIPMSQLCPFSSYVNLVERYNTFYK